jgi:hypothetical protein
MNKIVLAALVFVLALVATTAASAIPAPTLTVISGTVYELDNATVVPGATVTVTCTHASVDSVRTATSSAIGTYGVVFPVSQCDVGDSIVVEASKGSADGSNTGVVDHKRTCLVNTGIINVSIPEFGVIAAIGALVAGIGIVAYRRTK